MIRKPLRQSAAASAPQNGLADGYDPHRDYGKAGGEWCTWCRIQGRFFHEHRYLEVLRDKNYVSMKVSMIQENPKRVFLSLP